MKSEHITRVIDVKNLPEEFIFSPVDKLYLRLETIDHDKLKIFKNHYKTIKLIEYLNKKKKEEYYLIKKCYVCSFDDLDINFLYLKYSKCIRVEVNPSRCSNKFLKIIQNFVCNGEDSKIMKIHINNNFLCNPLTVINLIEIPWKHSFERWHDPSGAGSLYAGKNQSVIVYDNYAKDKTRCKNSTRVEFKFNSNKSSPVKRFSQFDSLSVNQDLFSSVRLPKILIHRMATGKAEEAHGLYVEKMFQNKKCHMISVQEAFKGKDRAFKDAFRRYRRLRVKEYVDLNEIYRRNFEIYLSKPMTSSEEEFCNTYSESLRREVLV